MATVADVRVKIGVDLQNFNRGMSNVTKGLDKVGKQMRATGKSLSLGLTAPILALGAKSIQLFDKQAKALAQVETAVRSTGGAAKLSVKQLTEQASALQRQTIFGDEEILQKVTANLLTFTSIAGDEFVRTQAVVLDLATRMGTDLTSATLQLGKALNDPVANLGALSRAGIQFSKEQKEVIKSLVETGKKAEAQRVILAELEVQFGGAAQAAAEAGAGPLQQLQNRLGDLAESIGELVLPSVLELADKISGVVDFLQNLSPETKKTAIAFVGMAAALGPILFILGGVAASFNAIFSAMALVAGLINPWTLAFAALAAIGIAIYRNWDAVKQAFVGTWEAIKGLITNLKDNFIGVWTGIFKAAELAIKGDFAGAWATLQQTTAEGTQGIITDLNNFSTDVGAAVAPAAAALMFDPFALNDFFEEGAIAAIAGAFTSIKNSAKGSLDTDEDSLSNSAAAAKESLASIRTEVGNVQALDPSFALIETALNGTKISASDLNGAFASILTSVNDVDLLAPAFATIKSALYDTEVDADELEAAFTAIETAVGDADLLAPAFATIKSGLGAAEVNADDLKGAFDDITAAVNSTDILAPAFATIKSALFGAEVNADDLEAAFTAIETAVGDADLLTPSFALLKTGLSGAELSADSVNTALANIATEISGVEGKLPDFSKIIKALSGTAPSDDSLVVAAGNVVLGVKGVNDDIIALEKLVPDFRNIRLALDGDANSIKDSADEASDSLGGIFSLIPTELTLPEGYKELIDNVVPTEEENLRWSEFVTYMDELSTDLNNASHFAFKMSGNLSDVEEAWRPLFGTDSPQWMKDLVKYATDAGLIVKGLEAMVDLLTPSTWTNAWKVLTDLGGHLGKILGLLVDIVVKIGQWILAQAGIGGGGGGGVTIGGTPGTNVPPVTIPGAGGAGGAGMAGGGLGFLGGATVGATFGIFAYGLQQMLADTTQSLLEQGLSTAQIGTATSLGGLLQGVGSMGGTGGGTPSWLSGLQGYMGTGGSANTSGVMGSMGMTTGGQTINVNLDGQTIATATMPYWSQELEIYGTNR